MLVIVGGKCCIKRYYFELVEKIFILLIGNLEFFYILSDMLKFFYMWKLEFEISLKEKNRVEVFIWDVFNICFILFNV